MDLIAVRDQDRSVNEVEESSDDDNNETAAVNQVSQRNLTTTVAQIHLSNSEGTQLGHRNIYHGAVEVENIFEIVGNNLPSLPYQIGSANGLSQTSVITQSSNGLQRNTQTPVASLYRQPSTSSGTEINEPLGRHYSSNAVSTSDHVTSEPDIENVPLIRKKNQDQYRKAIFFIPLILALLGFIALFSVAIIYSSHKSNDNDDDDNLPINFTHRYRRRSQWSARPPKNQIPLFKYIPPRNVVVSHTASHPCNTSVECVVAIRNIQAAHLAAHFDDIAYNFLVAGDGLIYEGRGWKESSASTPGMGCSSWAVAFVGNFEDVEPPKKQIDAFSLLTETGENVGRLKKNFKLFTQNQIKKTLSPGKELIKILETWNYWQPFNKELDLRCS